MTEPAPRGGADALLLDGLAGLTWLAPSASSLCALARPDPWAGLRHDPAAVLLLLRSAPAGGLPFPLPHLHGTAPFTFALERIAGPARGGAGWDGPLRSLHEPAWAMARLASALARRTGRADPLLAWCCGLLAPLGWLAVASLSPDRALDCWTDPALAWSPARTQEKHWGASAVAIARRLCRLWSLPAWAADTIGRLELPATGAARLSGDASLLAIVRLAAHLAAEVGEGPHLLCRDEALLGDAALLGVSLCSLVPAELLADEPIDVPAWQCPFTAPLLRDVLTLASENRRLRGGPASLGLEREVDELQAALRDQIRGEDDRLRQAKLSALAEFAAGAGHEINNPLAVISGQAQYVLSHGDEWLAGDQAGAARKALNTIIGQTRRVHAILRDLMLFARPAPARPDWFDLPTLLGEVAASFADLAGAKQVRTTLASPDRLAVWADADQLRQALGCLVRNGIEAAPAEGWVKLTAEAHAGPDVVEVWVEDSGPGPAPELRPHLFDPFFSGRSAGRGKGLGLPVAWRLARQQGGDVRLEAPRPGQPTRFVLTLPSSGSPDRLRVA